MGGGDGFRPGDVVDMPGEADGWGACRALLIERDAPNALGVRDEPGVHDWFILASETLAEGVITSLRTPAGATFVRRDPAALMAVRAHDNGLIAS